MKLFNRLAHREYRVLVAIAASALTMQLRQHVVDAGAQPDQGARAADYGRICEPSVSDAAKPRALPADCGIRTDMKPNRPHAPWV
ncbi:hypothetical protein AWB76_00292 [Caballeronia temeraria]|uniref:Uncharacterized protein n=1 Tax=Caballeronia temeraria TaxID=1777137 RepID=A0A157Z847_9BURK|nr:hypothetical protein [Caballeronia temeraria]SAK41593.1 hypothetical protein AWB76_00292 [Caballeronia temeraria]